jgi:hypothetical protein
MVTQQQAPPMNGDRDSRDEHISHFIPSVELKGSIAEKLNTLDRLITYLQRLRHGIAGARPVRGGVYEGPGRHVDAPSWPWFTAGVALGAMFVLMLIGAWLLA